MLFKREVRLSLCHYHSTLMLGPTSVVSLSSFDLNSLNQDSVWDF